MAIPRTIPERSLPCAAHDLVKPAGGGTIFTRQESTQRGGLRGGACSRKRGEPLKNPPARTIVYAEEGFGFLFGAC